MSPQPDTAAETTVHLVRHGEVLNPSGVLYGRRPGYHLSDLGLAMAEKVGKTLAERPVSHIATSPLERARETAAPLAGFLGIEPVLDARLIESSNVFEGKPFGASDNALRDPRSWRHLWNPFRPSWGEPYTEIATRMRAAVAAARDEVLGGEAVLVSHQLPIWVTRLSAEKRPFVHDPRRRQCTLCSVTSLSFVGTRLSRVVYSEPAGDLIPVKDRGATFSAGGADEEHRP
jgi:broad specificity phosphatase PhoE